MQRIVNLNESVDALATDARLLRMEMRKRTRTMWTAIIVGAVLLAAAICATYIITSNNSHQIDANNQKFCPIIESLAAPGATTPKGVTIQNQMNRLLHDRHFDCE